MKPTRFNIRVYGLLADKGRILVTDEYRLGMFMTKFPGGALEFGEGTIDCLKREFMEELGIDIGIVSHFYTTDYFQATTALAEAMQLLNIYYIVKAPKPFRFVTSGLKYDFPDVEDGAQSFRWIDIAQLCEDDLTMPIDKRIVPMIRKAFSGK